MLSTNDHTDTRYRCLAEGDIQFAMSVVVPQGGWRLSLETLSVISPPLNEKNVERSCHVLF